MIAVIGNLPSGVNLPDLDDCIYYKQQKIYSDEQLNKSEDLRCALKKGELTILEQSKDKDAEFEIPTFVSQTAPPPAAQAKTDDSVLSLLLEKLSSLEGTIQAQQVKETSGSDSEALQAICERLQRLEEKVTTAPAPRDAAVAEMIKNLAEKLEDSQKSSDPSEKLDSILNRLEKRLDGEELSDEPLSPGEVYVPTVTVEDVNAHIKLDVRTIENSDSVNASLKALRALKNP